MSKPDHVLVLDKTGCNTNTKQDKIIEEQKKVVSSNQTEVGNAEATADLRFYVVVQQQKKFQFPMQLF